jgi:hypothetical protein
MFDNLRDSAESSFYEEEPNDLYKAPEAKPASARVPKRRRSTRILGLNAQQRFIVSLMFMFTVCIMGTLAMLVLGKMGI